MPPSPEDLRTKNRPSFRGSTLLVPLSRLVLSVSGGVAGYQLYLLNRRQTLIPLPTRPWEIVGMVLMVVAGVLFGYMVGSLLARFVLRALVRLDELIARHSGPEMLVVFLGFIVGLGIAALFSLALARLPVVGVYLLPPVFLICGYVTAHVAQRKHQDILRLLGVRPRGPQIAQAPKVLDSSALIDGRVLDVVRAGFLDGDLLIPRFVVEELQRVADSSDPEKRVRGRRGLDFIHKLQEAAASTTIVDQDYADLAEVDAKLLRLASLSGAAVVTTDYNLNKVAKIQKVPVLNVNELANAVKSPVVPGEEIEVKILREGREHHQGVGYLEDGTMIVVEDGRELVGATVRAEVTSVLQSPSGKMIFAKPHK
ncbi:MAG: TRAM domain-containing protein [Actinobacteria bacterium]|nr:TRAM domain-containing protein [Actinomycetota bacterium]